MASKLSARSRKALGLLVIIGLSGLVILVMFFRRKKTPQEAIRKVLADYGVPEKTIRYWITVSAFETTYWTSKVLKQSNNLFNLIVPGGKHLDFGEGQSVYNNYEESVVALFQHVMKPFHYQLSYKSLEDLISDMKKKGYYLGSESDYQKGGAAVYKKLFG